MHSKVAMLIFYANTARAARSTRILAKPIFEFVPAHRLLRAAALRVRNSMRSWCGSCASCDLTAPNASRFREAREETTGPARRGRSWRFALVGWFNANPARLRKQLPKSNARLWREAPAGQAQREDAALFFIIAAPRRALQACKARFWSVAKLPDSLAGNQRNSSDGGRQPVVT